MSLPHSLPFITISLALLCCKLLPPVTPPPPAPHPTQIRFSPLCSSLLSLLCITVAAPVLFSLLSFTCLFNPTLLPSFSLVSQ